MVFSVYLIIINCVFSFSYNSTADTIIFHRFNCIFQEFRVHKKKKFELGRKQKMYR